MGTGYFSGMSLGFRLAWAWLALAPQDVSCILVAHRLATSEAVYSCLLAHTHAGSRGRHCRGVSLGHLHCQR